MENYSGIHVSKLVLNTEYWIFVIIWSDVTQWKLKRSTFYMDYKTHDMSVDTDLPMT